MKIETKYNRGDLLYIILTKLDNAQLVEKWLRHSTFRFSDVVSPVFVTGKLEIDQDGNVAYYAVNLINRDLCMVKEQDFITKTEANKFYTETFLPLMGRCLFGDFDEEIRGILNEEEYSMYLNHGKVEKRKKD